MPCKECEHNRHGWCDKYKAQKPQALINCSFDKNESSIVETKNEYKKAEDLLDTEMYVVTGRVQEFHTILRQIEANPSMVTEEFVSVLKSLYQHIETSISIYGIALESSIDEMILEDVRYIMKNL